MIDPEQRREMAISAIRDMLRKGDFKAVFWGRKGERNWELYDLSKDRNEMNNLAEVYPERLMELKIKWESWCRDVGS